MKVAHKLPKLNLSKECSASDFILSNGLGGFISLSMYPNSKHNGFFLAEGLDVFKVIEMIAPVDAPAVDSIENSLGSVKRTRGGLSETFIMPKGCNGFIYRLNSKAEIAVDMDCRKAGDLRSMGLYYQVTADDAGITVHFSKKTDINEDGSHGKDEFELYAIFRPKPFTHHDYHFLNQWNEFFYSLDAARHDSPTKRWLYRPFSVETKEILVGVGKTKDEAQKQIGLLSEKPKEEPHGKIMLVRKEKEVAAAFLCAQDSLEKLRVRQDGLQRTFAGFPWFYQYWTRDESISIGAMIQCGKIEEAKNVLMQYLKGIGKEGRIPNRVPSSDLASADGVGWVFKRVGDLVRAAKEKKMLASITKQDMAFIKKQIRLAIERIESNYMISGLIHNDPLETWMDTSAHGDSRSGFRIEIQALHLNMLRLAHELTGDKKYKDKEEEMKREVYENFWNGHVLADGLNDFTARPNIFLAYYVYPDLLSRKEWETAFDSALDRLWLDWGGLSSIDKTNSLMQWNYTGIDNMSYHRGDSWYWLNCLAAICMLRNNAIKFEHRIQQLTSASASEILWSGALGHHAEVSSASQLSSHGCLAQAWSDAMFIELIMEAYQ